MTAPRLLGIVAHCGLEGCQDGGEEWGGGRRKPEVLQIIDIITQAVRTKMRRERFASGMTSGGVGWGAPVHVSMFGL